MRKLIMQEWMTFDGIVQAPGSPNEDRSGGFEHGGWHLPYFDDASMQWVVENLTEAGGYLLGRRTYESFASHWPNASEEEQVLAQPLNERPKYVASKTLSEPLAWHNATVLDGKLADAVSELKEQDGGDLLVIGSANLSRSLIQQGLVDEFRLMIDPLIVGGGKRIFSEDGVRRPLRLVDSEVTTTGAILASYVPARD